LPWVIGIDEAGYGPNLGPLVMSAVGCRVPPGREGHDLWELLRAGVRRHGDADDGRVLVADSKLVFSQSRGLADLEHGVLAAGCCAEHPTCLAEFVRWAAPDFESELHREPWYRGETATPCAAPVEPCFQARELFQTACRDAGVGLELVRSFIVCPARFNQLLDEHESKAAVLAHGVHHFLRLPIPGEEPAHFFIDKQGGRNTYAAMLQHALPDGMVIAREEGRDRSVYRWVGGPREMCFTFTPRADVAHLCVALASMVSKYLREMLMAEFNGYWQGYVPGLKATAGYPGDALRFYQAIRPHLERLGIAEHTVWRRK
jgi:hypothetical protein